jgi:ABC-type multidrug transport system ATPase subunit
VFQGLALFPHLTVRGNVGFGLHRLPRAQRDQRVEEELISVGLQDLADRYPHQLSGGQQQRVAIARSLVLRPALMLMDEPFSDMDTRTRQQVRDEVLRILREHRTPAIIVTHDREDAFHVADRIAEMENGRIVRVEKADVIRLLWSHHPFEASPFGMSHDEGSNGVSRLEQLRAMLVDEPGDVFLHYAIALELKAASNRPAAMMQFYMLLDIDPEHIPAHYQLALIFAEMGQTGDAIAKARAGIELAEAQRDVKALREFRELLRNVGGEA